MTDTPMTAAEARTYATFLDTLTPFMAQMNVAAGEKQVSMDPGVSMHERNIATLRAYADLLDRKAPDGLREAVRSEIAAAVRLQQLDPETGPDIDAWTARILALIQQPAVKVKTLEWRPSHLTGALEAQTPFGEYGAGEQDVGGFYWCLDNGEGEDVGGYPTLEAAKAAAQAHYDNAIREALEEGTRSYRERALEQINNGSSKPNEQLDSRLLDEALEPSMDAKAANMDAQPPCASDSAVSEPVPEGMVVVPCEPTYEQLLAGEECIADREATGTNPAAGCIYRAMLSAAPTGET